MSTTERKKDAESSNKLSHKHLEMPRNQNTEVGCFHYLVGIKSQLQTVEIRLELNGQTAYLNNIGPCEQRGNQQCKLSSSFGQDTEKQEVF